MRSRKDLPGLFTLAVRDGPGAVVVFAEFKEAVLFVLFDGIAGSDALMCCRLVSAAAEVFVVFLLFEAGFVEDVDAGDDAVAPVNGAFLVPAVVDFVIPEFLSRDIVDCFRPMLEVELPSDCD